MEEFAARLVDALVGVGAEVIALRLQQVRRQPRAAIAATVLHIVGTATMPAIGFPSSEGNHPSMGTGALIPEGIEPAALRRALTEPYATLNGPEFVFVRMRIGVSDDAGLADM